MVKLIHIYKPPVNLNLVIRYTADTLHDFYHGDHIVGTFVPHNSDARLSYTEGCPGPDWLFEVADGSAPKRGDHLHRKRTKKRVSCVLLAHQLQVDRFVINIIGVSPWETR